MPSCKVPQSSDCGKKKEDDCYFEPEKTVSQLIVYRKKKSGSFYLEPQKCVSQLFGASKKRHLLLCIFQIVARLPKIVACSAKSAAILYPGTSCTNHKSVVHFLIKKWHTNFTNGCILFDAYRIPPPPPLSSPFLPSSPTSSASSYNLSL